MNLLIKTGLITATSLGLIACGGGANNDSNTPGVSKAPVVEPAPAPANDTYSPRSILNLPLVIAGSLGYVSKVSEDGPRGYTYASKFVFKDYKNNGLLINGNGGIETNFKITGTDTINGTFKYDFDLSADDTNDGRPVEYAKDKRFCKLSGNSEKHNAGSQGYKVACSAGSAINPSDKQEYKLVNLEYSAPGQPITFSGTFKGIPGGDVKISGQNLIPCNGNNNGFFQSGTVTIKRNSAQQDTTTLTFNSCKDFTAMYKDNIVSYTINATNSK